MELISKLLFWVANSLLIPDIIILLCLFVRSLILIGGTYNMTKEAIEKIAEGRVWTGETAKKLGLVDELGGIDKALDIAVAKAGIEGYTVVSYPAKQDFFSSLLDTKPTNYVESQLLKSKLGEFYQQFGLLKNLQEQSMIQARIPFELNIK